MSLRHCTALLQKGLREAAGAGLEACATLRYSGGASTSGRSCLNSGTGFSMRSWANFPSSFGSIRSIHVKVDSTARRYTAAELGLYWSAAAVAMIGVSYASVPLYRMFCAATGYGGTVRAGASVEEKLKRRIESPNPKVEEAAAGREIRVWFNADVGGGMPWDFKPTQEYVRVRPGQSTLVFFTAHNKSDQPVTGYSLYNVTPDKAAFYFNKIQCFCFEEQRLRGRETIDMPVFFYIDPEFATDWNCRNVNDITLSYVFNRIDDSDLDDEPDDGRPTVVKLHAGPHPPAGAGPGQLPQAAQLQAVASTAAATVAVPAATNTAA